jgi:hypothetical protein
MAELVGAAAGYSAGKASRLGGRARSDVCTGMVPGLQTDTTIDEWSQLAEVSVQGTFGVT